jgi:gliding motility associated protien GldN
MRKLSAFILAILICTPILYAQEKQEGYRNKKKDDYTYEQNIVKERTVVPDAHIREADVLYRKRIQRVIDSREKMNRIMRWPKNPLHEIVYAAAVDGDIKAYKSDSFKTTFTREEILQKGTREITTQIEDPPGSGYFKDTTIKTEFQPERITRYRIIEDWIFEKQRGMYFPRIIGVAPLYKLERQGQDLGYIPLFFVLYDELEHILVNETVFNRHNDAMRLSYFDIFEQRMFSSYITKESNVFDRRIRNFEEFSDDKIATLYEARRVEEELFNFEHDLWSY